MRTTFPESTAAQIEPLRVRGRPGASASGYRFVYLDTSKRDSFGQQIYYGKVKLRGRLHTVPGSRTADRRACALAVVKWLRARFGDGWADAMESRTAPPYAVRHSGSRRGHVAAVWVGGAREEVCELRHRRGRWAPTDALEVFPTARAARAGVWRYLVRRYGLLAYCLPSRLAA